MKAVAKFLLEVIKSPVGIGFSVTHWIVVLYAICGETHSAYFHFTDEPLLTQWLYLLNLPAFVLGGLLFFPVVTILGESIVTKFFVIFLYFLCITLQWLMVGFIINKVVTSLKSNKARLSVFNE